MHDTSSYSDIIIVKFQIDVCACVIVTRNFIKNIVPLLHPIVLLYRNVHMQMCKRVHLLVVYMLRIDFVNLYARLYVCGSRERLGGSIR